MNDMATEVELQLGLLTVERERWPSGQRYIEFHDVITEHFIECGNPMDIDVASYAIAERQGKFAFFVARVDRQVVGFAGFWVYEELHISAPTGHDDFWHVSPGFRRHGIGAKLKELGNAWQKNKGCKQTILISKRMTPEQMEKLGYHVIGRQYRKEL
jgi:GNAT superfamily N-acetyltransferase